MNVMQIFTTFLKYGVFTKIFRLKYIKDFSET